ncbi:MAG: cyclic nucleotide-binding protein [Rhodobacteraceae bacterium]|nr:cyclic nucleotide-binding protein [Paracoccaceae bacterium]
MGADREDPDDTPGPERQRQFDPDVADDTAKPPGEAGAARSTSFKHRVFRLLELGSSGDRQGQWVDRILLVFIVATVVLVVLETVPSIQQEWSALLDAFEFVVGAVFLTEYLLRLWVADLHPPFRRLKPLQARLRYAVRGEALIDLLAVLPFFIGFLLPAGDFKTLVVLRLLRFFKLARYSPALRSLANAVAGERHALGASLVIIFGVMLLAATGMYLVERSVQPEKLGTIPHAMWWALATLTTVGYGDVVPVTVAGKLLGGLVMLMGYGLFALPIGIVATAFAREIHARDFVVTWGMVASVPLFEDLRASEIAEISKLLRALSVDGGQPITRVGEEATSMYFIARGAVIVELGNTRARLEEGAFFGEMAILGGRRRLASVSAAEATQLMILEASDLQRLMSDKPEIARKILEEVKARTQLMTASGDIVPEELKAAMDAEESLTEEECAPDTDTGPDLFAPETARSDAEDPVEKPKPGGGGDA